MSLNKTVSVICLALMMLPMMAAAMPVGIEPAEQPVEEGWWVETTVDTNANGIGDMIEKFNDHPLFLDADNTLPIIVDFDHTPTPADVAMLEREVGYVHAWDLPLIDAVAGRLPHGMIREATTLPGVVMLELDGLLEAQRFFRRRRREAEQKGAGEQGGEQQAAHGEPRGGAWTAADTSARPRACQPLRADLTAL